MWKINVRRERIATCRKTEAWLPQFNELGGKKKVLEKRNKCTTVGNIGGGNCSQARK